jgi:hypothetical protein
LLCTKDGNTEDTVGLQLLGQGTPSQTSNRERLILSYSAASHFRIYTSNVGSGVLRPLRIYTGADSDQVYLAVDGKTGFQNSNPQYTVDITGTFRVSSTAYFSGEVQFVGDVIMDNLPVADPEVSGQLWNDSNTVKVSEG